MKLKYVFLAILIAHQTVAQSSREAELTTAIDEVTVFLTGAQVVRTGDINLKPGESSILVKALSPYLEAKSIRVKAEGDFTILSVNHNINYLDELAKDQRIDSLNHIIDSIEQAVSLKSARLEILAEKQTVLNANKSLGGENVSSSLDQLKQTIDFYDQELSEIKSEELAIKRIQRELSGRKARIEKQIADVQQQEDLPTSEIRIRVEADEPVKGEFNITYLVANAGWYPNYDVRVASVDQPITLTYKADVYQNTGVDWDDVKLRFSNSNPNESGVAPELATWYLNYPRNTVYRRPSPTSIRKVAGRVVALEDQEPLPGVNVIVKGSTIGTVTDLQGNYSLTLPNNAETLVFSFIGLVPQEIPIVDSRIDVALEEDVMQLQEVVSTGYATDKLQGRVAGVSVNNRASQAKKAKPIVTTTVENQTTVEFEVANPYSIQSDGEKLSVSLNEYQIETAYEYYAVPKLDKDAFLIAKITNWDQYDLLEGEANLYFEDAFVGRSVLDAKALTDTLSISLGRDKSIVVGRQKADQFAKKRILGSNKVESREFEIIARNRKSQPIKLTLFDQIPVSAIGDISVEATELSGGKLNEKTGQVSWELTLQPQQQIELALNYEVKYPNREKVILE
jgi:hypothetical protein